MALTTVSVEQLSTNAVDRVLIARALKTLRDEAEARLLAIESGVAATSHIPVTNTTTLAAIAAASRADGMTCVTLDTLAVWRFDASGVGAASDWCVVPAAGTGRWLRMDETTGAIGAPVADAAALQAIAATGRVDGMFRVKLDDYTLWRFAAGSAASASDFVIVPAVGTGRWVRADEVAGGSHAPVADAAAVRAIAAVSRANGMTVTKLDDDTIWTFDSGSSASASDWVLVPDAGTGRWLRSHLSYADLLDTAAIPGTPMQSRLHLDGAAGVAIAPADFLTIDTTLFEFRGDTPPTAGTAGRVWVYNGANAAASRVNLIDAINGVVDAARIDYNGLTGPNVLASAGVAPEDIIVRSATAPGGAVAPSGTALATTDNLTEVGDIWDAAAMYGGAARQPRKSAVTRVTLTAAMIAKGSIEVVFDFTPSLLRSHVENNLRKQDEAIAVVGNALSVTLAGGASPQNQAADVLTFFASE